MKDELGTNIAVSARDTIFGAAASFVITGAPVGYGVAAIVFVVLLAFLHFRKSK